MTKNSRPARENDRAAARAPPWATVINQRITPE
jgi:hypothetical protein